MMLESLREEVLEANLELVRRGLVVDTFGNASGISREHGLVAIKPSGVPYTELRPSDLVVTDLDGRIVEGALRPSSDLPTHIALYRAFPGIGVQGNSLPRHDARGLLSGPRSGNGSDDGRGNRKRIRMEHRSSDCAALRDDGPDANASRAGSGARSVLLGRNARGSRASGMDAGGSGADGLRGADD